MVIAAPVLKPKPATLPVNSFLQRLMLITDGRITDIIQAYSGKIVKAVKLHQQLIILSDRSLLQDRSLQLMERSILLQGTKSKTNCLYGDSQIVYRTYNVLIKRSLFQIVEKLPTT